MQVKEVEIGVVSSIDGEKRTTNQNQKQQSQYIKFINNQYLLIQSIACGPKFGNSMMTKIQKNDNEKKKKNPKKKKKPKKV